jgi:hypothetical protein
MGRHSEPQGDASSDCGIAMFSDAPMAAAHVAQGLSLELLASLSDHSALLWRWSYATDGAFAHGTLTTSAMADADGFYEITGIAGERNGETIIGLQPAGTAIPGNEPFAVDNLISTDQPQLTADGFGYALADGTFANPFFADFLTPATYLEFFSAPPFGPGTGPEDSELPANFAARVVPSWPFRHDGDHHSPQREGAEHWHGLPTQVACQAATSDWFA